MAESRIKFVMFKGDWVINSLAFTAEVFYEKNLLLINGSSTEDKHLDIKEFIKALTRTELDMPSSLDALKLTRGIGKIQDGTFSLVLVGEVGTNAKVSIVHRVTKYGICS